MKPRIQLIALDLDGTAFNSSGVISPVDQKAIRDAADRGITVMIATGRPLVGVPLALAEELGIRYALTTNGAAVYSIPEQKLVYESCMSMDQAGEALARIQELDVYFDLFIQGKAYSLAARRGTLSRTTLPQSLKDYISSTRNYVEDVLGTAERIGAGIQKVTMNFYRGPDGKLVDRQQVKEILSEYPELAVVSGGFDNLELTRADTNKGRALRFMADHLGIPIEETMAVGDTENDLSIICAAGLGVAMENAEKSLREKADVVTRSNDEGGVAYAIEHWTR